MSPARARPRQRPTWRTLLWLCAIGSIIVVGMIYIPREYPGLSFWACLYATARLFVFEYDLPHFPTAWPLIAIHFIAPVIAVSAAWTLVNRLFRLTPALRLRWVHDHIVVCGAGRNGRLVARTLKERGLRVVAVDIADNDVLEEWQHESRIPVIQGSFHTHAVLERAGAERARAMIFAAGDDLANLEGAVGAHTWLAAMRGGPRVILTHIAHEKLASTAASVVASSGRPAIRFFDTYRIAARRVISQYFDRKARAGIDRLTIVGFGKFGRDLTELLIRDLLPENQVRIGVVDICDRGAQVMSLAEDLGVAERVDFRRADIRELDFAGEPGTAFFLCTDDDMGNLTGAFELAGRMRESHVYVRMTRWPLSAIADQLSSHHLVTFININELVAEGIREGELPGIFSPLTPLARSAKTLALSPAEVGALAPPVVGRTARPAPRESE